MPMNKGQWKKKTLILPMVEGQSLSTAENSQLLNEMIVGLVMYFDPILNRQL